jgi:hypothetical protein
MGSQREHYAMCYIPEVGAPGERAKAKKNMGLTGFSGERAEAKGIISKELMVGSKTVPTTFFVVDVKGRYNVLLGRDWIHDNGCMPSTLHQCLIQWDGDKWKSWRLMILCVLSWLRHMWMCREVG